MSIKVLYFASLRETKGCADEIIDSANIKTVEDVWLQVNQDQAMPEHILCAVNQEYAEQGTLLQDGDEVAFFPPVTGGQ